MRRFLLIIFALLAGMAGESLLVLRAQVERFESLLRDDFRVLLFLKNEPSDADRKLLEERLLALSHTRQIRYVSRDEALAALRQDDPELVDSVTWLGENPLLPAFEARLASEGLGEFDEWLRAVREAGDWVDVRYRPGQVRAVLQAQVYVHYLSLVLSVLLCGAAVALAARLWWFGSVPGLKAAAWAVFGNGVSAAAGMVAALLAALPARQYLPWWESPTPASQLMLWGCIALLGGLLYPWTAAD
ncbi:MAG TPA: hypothetical protein DCP85_06350 [Elusimicrobia bacterium]|nr:hypothetical protein [Elusimicrobiota bacterium]